jgi:hypothetical protein
MQVVAGNVPFTTAIIRGSIPFPGRSPHWRTSVSASSKDAIVQSNRRSFIQARLSNLKIMTKLFLFHYSVGTKLFPRFGLFPCNDHNEGGCLTELYDLSHRNLSRSFFNGLAATSTGSTCFL